MQTFPSLPLRYGYGTCYKWCDMGFGRHFPFAMLPHDNYNCRNVYRSNQLNIDARRQRERERDQPFSFSNKPYHEYCPGFHKKMPECALRTIHLALIHFKSSVMHDVFSLVSTVFLKTTTLEPSL